MPVMAKMSPVRGFSENSSALGPFTSHDVHQDHAFERQGGVDIEARSLLRPSVPLQAIDSAAFQAGVKALGLGARRSNEGDVRWDRMPCWVRQVVSIDFAAVKQGCS